MRENRWQFYCLFGALVLASKSSFVSCSPIEVFRTPVQLDHAGLAPHTPNDFPPAQCPSGLANDLPPPLPRP